MDSEVIELINNLLRIAYEFGWEVGASWDPKHYPDLVDINGYLKDDRKIDTELKENVEKLLTKLGYSVDSLRDKTQLLSQRRPNKWN